MMRLAEKLLTKVEGVCRLTPNDANLFRCAFNCESLLYANSWLYILRGSRNAEGELGYKFYKQGVIVGIGFRNGLFYLTRPIGKRRFEIVLHLCHQLKALTESQIILKKLDGDLYRYLITKDSFYKSTDVNDIGIFEDEAFPEHLVTLSKLFAADLTLNPSAHNLSRQIKRFQKSAITLTPVSNFQRNEIEDILNAMYKLIGTHQEKYYAYLPIIREVFTKKLDRRRYKICAFYEGTRMHGLYIAEFLSSETMGLYCALSSRAISGITEWMDVYFLQSVFQDGIKVMLLGGSETKGVDGYVKKLLPETPDCGLYPLVFGKK